MHIIPGPVPTPFYALLVGGYAHYCIDIVAALAKLIVFS